MLYLFLLEQLESLLSQPRETEIEKVKVNNGIPSLLGKDTFRGGTRGLARGQGDTFRNPRL